MTNFFDEYTNDELNAQALQRVPGMGRENHVQTITYPRGRARYRDANWMP